MDLILNNVQRVQAKIAACCASCGREVNDIQIMAVTKTQSREAVLALHNAGMRLFGESRLQEALLKYQQMPEDSRLHMIGHVQSNKVSQLIKLVHCIQSVDSVALASQIQKQCEKADTAMRILLEIKTSAEPSKYGLQPNLSELKSAVSQILPFERVKIQGLMTMAPFCDDTELIRKSFRMLKQLQQQLLDCFSGIDLSTLSMGMSDDYPLAIEEGSTCLRLGRLFFQ